MVGRVERVCKTIKKQVDGLCVSDTMLSRGSFKFCAGVGIPLYGAISVITIVVRLLWNVLRLYKHNGLIMPGSSRKSITAVLLLFTYSYGIAAELRWDGEGNDGLWHNPSNWSSNTLPTDVDNIVLDNSTIANSYIVTLGPGSGLINIRSLRISPGGINTISVIIPASNIESPAMRCLGSVYGLVLDFGASLINESGASSGSTIEVNDSIRINNGGRYVHRTARSHAETVRSLSRAPGTEEGIFEFGIPVASSTISLSGQVFGSLRLGPGPNGLINYTGTGTNSVTIRSDLEILPGVNLSLNLEGILSVGRNITHQGGIFNLSSTARYLRLEVGGNLRQAAGAIFTESGSAFPEIILRGILSQELDLKGSITNDVTVKIDNPAGVVLRSNLSLPYKLSLERGAITTTEYVVSLQPFCYLQVSANNSSFINGKLEKKGLINSSFLFPVGKNGVLRWLQLHEASGDFVIEYIRSDPNTLGSSLGIGIAHISSMEHWSIMNSGPMANARIELTFDNVNSGGITDLENLRVARFIDNSWENAGNSATTGSAGANGSVSSLQQQWVAGQVIVFSLASSVANQNPLPLGFRNLRAVSTKKGVRLEWNADVQAGEYFEIEKARDGRNFSNIDVVAANPGSSFYTYFDTDQLFERRYYRILRRNVDSGQTYSRIMIADPVIKKVSNATVFIDRNQVHLAFNNAIDTEYQVEMIDNAGVLVLRAKVKTLGGRATIGLPRIVASGSIIFVRIINEMGNTFTLKAVVQ